MPEPSPLVIRRSTRDIHQHGPALSGENAVVLSVRRKRKTLPESEQIS